MCLSFCVLVSMPGRSFWPGRQDVPQCAWSLVFCFQTQHGRRQRAYTRVLLPARVPAQLQQLWSGSVEGKGQKCLTFPLLRVQNINICLCCLCPSGAKQNGTKLADVILPPWAKGDPREFIRVHREVRNKPARAKDVSQWQCVDIWVVFHRGCRRWSAIMSRLTSMNGLTSFLATSNKVHQL